jgi:hypothetical protein
MLIILFFSMAPLFTLSPLSPLYRGFEITEFFESTMSAPRRNPKEEDRGVSGSGTYVQNCPALVGLPAERQLLA